MQRNQWNFVWVSGLMAAAVLLVIYSFGKTDDFVSFYANFVATSIGVFFALQLNKEESEKATKEEFESILKVLDIELEYNLSVLRGHRAIAPRVFNYGALRASLLNLIVEKTSMIKYGGKVLHQALLDCRTKIDSYSIAYRRIEEFAHSDRGVPEPFLAFHQDIINQTEYAIMLLRTLIQKYSQNPSSLLQEETYLKYVQAIQREKEYRAENRQTAYERLTADAFI